MTPVNEHIDGESPDAIGSDVAAEPSYSADAIGQLDSGTTLAPHHLAMLRNESGINDACIAARGYRTITDAKELRELGFAPNQCRVPALLLPLWTTDGSNGHYVLRPDNPRVHEDKRKHKLPDGTYTCKVIKYEIPKDSGIRLDSPPACRAMLANPAIPLWVTEGQKKADSLASHGLCAIALLGVWNFAGKNEFSGTTFLSDWQYVALDNREVRIIFDSDVMTKPEVRKALERLTEHLQRKKAHVTAVYLPPGPKGKQGVDDYLASGHTIDDLENLVGSPRPMPQPAAPIVELMEVEPLTIRRPLALLTGRAYAVVWPTVKVTVTETVDKQGNIVKHNPPMITTEARLFVVRDDGLIYGSGADKPLEALEHSVKLPEIPPSDKLWSSRGVNAFRRGYRPDPAQIYHRVVEVIIRFIDFDRSLADQRTMAEMIACYIISTWFLDAFTVIGFLWPNGDRGSGKTQLLVVICELAYLGQVILSGGSFASLRDLADYGACLAFDDAEGLSDPRKTDPDKRTLLLAGNRRGNTVPVKEPNGDRTWRTRYVDTFCPRLFSATQLPDPILASRTITIPLIRTPDRFRANADPLDYAKWPHERRALLDDLWALGLTHLHELPKYEALVNEKATLTGRSLEPWRALLSVAAWLDERGVSGLWQRIEQLSRDYQNERVELETSDMTALVIRAICECAKCHVEPSVPSVAEGAQGWNITTSDVTNQAIALARESDSDYDPDRISTKKVGIILKKMRLDKPPRPGGKGPRFWRITQPQLKKWTTAYGLTLPDELQQPLSENQIDFDTQLPLGTLGLPGTLGTDNELSEGAI